MPSPSRRPSVKDPVVRAYDALQRDIDRLMDLIPGGTNLKLVASHPDGTPGIQDLPPEAAAMIRERVLPALQALDATLPMEREAGDEVWETLVLDGHGHSGRAWLCVVNAIGAQEGVTVFGTPKGYGGYISSWGASRRDSEDLGTSWDIARRERKVVPYDGEPTLIDRGANRIVELLTAMGHPTVATCEGHPMGAYALFERGLSPAEMEVFQDSGWEIDPGADTVRMPRPASVADRDERWRAICSALEARFDIEPLTNDAAGPKGP